LKGFATAHPQDLTIFRIIATSCGEGHSATAKRPVCKGEIKVKSLEPVKRYRPDEEGAGKANVTEG
jgi:hypothetical protein